MLATDQQDQNQNCLSSGMDYTGGHGSISLNEEVYAYKITVRLAIEHTIWQKQIRNIETMVIRKEEDTASTYVYK